MNMHLSWLLGADESVASGLHLAKIALAGCVDRHEHIGQGAIGLGGFQNFLRDPRFAGKPMVIETPKGEDLEEDRINLQRLRSLF